MQSDTKQHSVLEWLQLSPDLLSGRTAMRPVAAASQAPAALPVPATSDVASITLQSVLMGPSIHEASATPAALLQHGELWQGVIAHSYPISGRRYSSLEQGGSQVAALAEMTGYLLAPLAPTPTKARD